MIFVLGVTVRHDFNRLFIFFFALSSKHYHTVRFWDFQNSRYFYSPSNWNIRNVHSRMIFCCHWLQEMARQHGKRAIWLKNAFTMLMFSGPRTDATLHAFVFRLGNHWISMYTAGVLEIPPAYLRYIVWEKHSFSEKKNINGGTAPVKDTRFIFTSNKSQVYHPLAGDRASDIFFFRIPAMKMQI